MNNPLRLTKPPEGQACNGCGYCCSASPCDLAREFLKSETGPCVALETVEGIMRCGFVRNPLAYLYQASNPDEKVDVLGEPPQSEEGYSLSVQLATALGVGQGCDSEDDHESAQWNLIASA